MADLVIGCDEWDVALSKPLIGYLPVESLLVELNRQEGVGPPLCELPKNA